MKSNIIKNAFRKVIIPFKHEPLGTLALIVAVAALAWQVFEFAYKERSTDAGRFTVVAAVPFPMGSDCVLTAQLLASNEGTNPFVITRIDWVLSERKGFSWGSKMAHYVYQPASAIEITGDQIEVLDFTIHAQDNSDNDRDGVASFFFCGIPERFRINPNFGIELYSTLYIYVLDAHGNLWRVPVDVGGLTFIGSGGFESHPFISGPSVLPIRVTIRDGEIIDSDAEMFEHTHPAGFYNHNRVISENNWTFRSEHVKMLYKEYIAQRDSLNGS